MKTRAVILITIIMTGFCFAIPSYGQTTTVRGQVIRANGVSPVPGITVDLLIPNANSRSVPSVTGPNGMYYLYNIPAGDYYLEVWVSSTPLVYPVRIFFGTPQQDLPRSVVPW
jgi:hypothetical protein